MTQKPTLISREQRIFLPWYQQIYLGLELSHHQQVHDMQYGVIYNIANDIIEDDITNVA